MGVIGLKQALTMSIDDVRMYTEAKCQYRP